MVQNMVEQPLDMVAASEKKARLEKTKLGKLEAEYQRQVESALASGVTGEALAEVKQKVG